MTGEYANGKNAAAGRERLHVLLADRAVCGLSVDEMKEFHSLQHELEIDADGDWSFDLAAAGIDLACMDPAAFEPMPAALAEKVRIHPTTSQPATSNAGNDTPVSRNADPDVVVRISSDSPGSASRSHIPAWVPWLAAAACFVFAVAVELQVLLPASGPSISEQYHQLVEKEPDTIVLPWAAGNEISHVNGDVVWNNRLQAGFMRISGLDMHEAGNEVYQLWIVDNGRPDQPPVDGGVFDVDAATGDIYIPINAKLPIRQPAVFAVTEEADPLGVVVSEKGKRGEFVIVAPVS